MQKTKKRKYSIKVLYNNTYGVVMSCKGIKAGSMSQLVNQRGTNIPSIQKVLANTSKRMIVYCKILHHCKRLTGVLKKFANFQCILVRNICMLETYAY